MAATAQREREFDRLKARLEELQRTLRTRLGKVQDNLRRTGEDDGPKEFEERAQHAENDPVIEVLDQRVHTELARTEEALHRMGAGDYGTCIDCGEDIQLARLKAIPWAQRCVDCARAHSA